MDYCVCGKVILDSYQRAAEVAKRMRRRRDAHVRPYRCKLAANWHLGGAH